MSNYGALAILALTMKRRRKVPSPDEADLRWLIVLETFPADADGWRRAGAQLLADEAGLAYSTSRAARDRLVAAGVIEYRPGTGRGKRSAYRFATPLKVPTMERHLAEAGEDCSEKGAETPPGKVPRQAEKGAGHNPLTSENANPALEAFALDTSALSLAAPQAAGDVARERGERDDDVIEGKITRAPVGASPLVARIAADVGCPVADARAFVQHMRGDPNVRSATALLNTALRNGTIADLYAEKAAGAAAMAELSGRPDRPPRPAPEARRPPPDALEPQEQPWKQVGCPVCKAAPGQFCHNPATRTSAATHPDRRRAADARAGDGGEAA